MGVTVRANSKDENYFAPAAGWTTRTRRPREAVDGRIGKTGDWRGCLAPLLATLFGDAIWRRYLATPLGDAVGRRCWATLFHELNGGDMPLRYPAGRMRERLLFLAGKSSLAQLSERHFAAHGLAVGLA
jgi:hypothetical protein